MNKTLKMLALALTMCAATCGTAMAAPKGGHQGGKAPAAARATAPKKQVVKAIVPAKQLAMVPAKGCAAPAKTAPKCEDAHRAKHHEPHAVRHEHEHRHHHHHHDKTLHADDWCKIGVSLLAAALHG